MSFRLVNHTQEVSGWRVDHQLPLTVATMYRWIGSSVDIQYPGCDIYKSFALFRIEVQPSGVLTYNLCPTGDALRRDCQELVSPGDYGIYNAGAKTCKLGGLVILTRQCYRWIKPARLLSFQA
jgi:hypothetical protein